MTWAFAASTVSAGTGWYLMFPPTDKNLAALDQAPIRQWSIVSSHDKAKECEADRLQAVKEETKARRTIGAQYEDTVRKAAKNPTAANVELRDAMEMRYKNAASFWGQVLASRCVASDDPRLAK